MTAIHVWGQNDVQAATLHLPLMLPFQDGRNNSGTISPSPEPALAGAQSLMQV